MRFFLLVFLFFCLPLRAEDLLPRAQRELRARKLYFGEIDGCASKESSMAIKRFQLTKGIDASGNLDRETIRALGLPVPEGDRTDGEARTLENCGGCVLQYLQARESDRWEGTAPLLAEEVDYYFERQVKRDALREILAGENRRWPRRRYTLLNRVAALLPGGEGAQVTVRVQTRAEAASGPAHSETEDLIFRLRKSGDRWKITAVKLLE